MNITVNKLGHIQKAENIDLKKLNVLIGKNGSGKTYFAKLIYFLNEEKYKARIFGSTFDKKLKDCFDNKKAINFSIEEQKEFQKELHQSIRKGFSDLIGSKQELFRDFSFEFGLHFNELEVEFDQTIKIYKDYVPYVGTEYLRKSFLILNAHYLPAARANYMITYKYLFESQFNNFRDLLLNKKKDRRFSILPEVENRFLEDIYTVDTKLHGGLFDFGTKIEKEIFKNGKLSIKNPNYQDLPTYEYRLKENKIAIDLVSASSAITELSPLIMYFRHKIQNPTNELLIIDEPELSLHPDAQAALVSILVEAVNLGLMIVLVTHSPYIIEAINNHLQRAKINDYEMSKKIKSIAPLKYEDTSILFFEDGTIKNILDNETKLIDDKLLNTFNAINNDYDAMRDIEWSHRG